MKLHLSLPLVLVIQSPAFSSRILYDAYSTLASARVHAETGVDRVAATQLLRQGHSDDHAIELLQGGYRLQRTDITEFYEYSEKIKDEVDEINAAILANCDPLLESRKHRLRFRQLLTQELFSVGNVMAVIRLHDLNVSKKDFLQGHGIVPWSGCSEKRKDATMGC